MTLAMARCRYSKETKRRIPQILLGTTAKSIEQAQTILLTSGFEPSSIWGDRCFINKKYEQTATIKQRGNNFLIYVNNL
jgi:hypothetical protein